MKIGIYGSINAGVVKDKKIDYIGVDQGTIHLLNQGITPLIAIGDMDSIEDLTALNEIAVKKVSMIKDDTDTELAIKYAIENAYHEIDIYGVTQKRMDHFMVIISLLEKYQNYNITIYDQWNKILVLKPGVHKIKKDGYKYFSLFAFDESIITLKDCHYPLESYVLKRDNPLCVSNQINGEYATIQVSRSLLFMQTL